MGRTRFLLVVSALAGGVQVLCSGCAPLPSEDELVGRFYYEFEEGYACVTLAPDAVPILSWKDRLGFHRDPETGVLMAHFTGDACSDYDAASRFNRADFTFSPDLSLVFFEGRVFEYRSEIPQF